eukprot:GILK01001239.1.p1 GENE.GILK01001239.1~~GILK01001239.1.p1  ORF type:complete len:545 (-),score=91.63 GILK01001239.1:96-1514(-)
MELWRSLLVFHLCTNRWLVKNSASLLKTSEAIFGKTITYGVVKATFFKHFCAGEDSHEVLSTVKRLQAAKIGAIFDYAAEAAIDDAKSVHVGTHNPELEYDRNTELSIDSINTASQNPGCFTAIKLTALADPVLLQKLSRAQMHMTSKFSLFDTNKDNRVSEKEFLVGLNETGCNVSASENARLFASLKPVDGQLDWIQWSSYINIANLHVQQPASMLTRALGMSVTAEEQQQLVRLMNRLNALAAEASKKNVRIMVDAEQTYLQPAIDSCTLDLQSRFNMEEPVIYNTYQCYLKGTESRVKSDLERAKRQGFQFAAKVVRGAYMVEERRKAVEFRYEDPIHNTISDTHDAYNRTVDHILQHISRAALCVASHNEHSVGFATSKMEEYGIAADSSSVVFGQLLGMCDYITYALSNNNYKAYKYVPYGPVHEVIPYLLRRAQENSDIFGSVGKETGLLWSELKRRNYVGLGSS